MAFLDTVIDQKKQEIAAKQGATPLDTLRSRAAAEPPPRDFRKALHGGERIISEVKGRSPRVDFFPRAANADDLVRTYEANGAAALSVVTDAKNFGTSLEDARRLRRIVRMPVIVKDFYIDPYQVYEARSYGADAVLLIARILDNDSLASLLDLVHDLDMNALVECHTREDIDKAAAAGAHIIGVNNRNLDTLAVSLDTTRRLAEHVPGDALLVSESGIYSRTDIETLSGAGADAFLIGGALLESNDPGALLRHLLGSTEDTHSNKDVR